MVDDIKTADPKNELVKFADGLTLEVPGNVSGDTSQMEFDNVQAWSRENRMPLNIKKTNEMIIRGIRLWLCRILSPLSNERHG